MNIHQLKAICEIVKQGLRMSTAAEALFTSKPGISRQVKEIEDEIGVRLFERRKNKIEALTPAGREIVAIAERILRDIETVRQIGKEHSRNDAGELVVATTHTHARYCLPKVIDSFTREFPKVKVILQQGKPGQCCELVATGGADIAICTETSPSCCNVISLPVYRVERCIVARRNHPILKLKRLTLEKLAQYPIITFDAAFGGQKIVTDAFSRAGIQPHVILSVADPEVAKAYVERGMGVTIVAKVAFNARIDRSLQVIDAEHLFKSSMLHVTLRKQPYLRGYVYSFISLYAPHLSKELVLQAIQGSKVDIPRLEQEMPLLA